MLTNHTNLTQSATQTQLINGSRSLALVVDVNTAQAYAPRCHKRFHLHVGPMMSAGMPFSVRESESIRIRGIEPIPGSPRGEGWPGSGRSHSSRSWSLCLLPARLRGFVRRAVPKRRVVSLGLATKNAVARRAATALNAVAMSIDHAPVSVQTAFARPALMGG
ncbi:hypothetical protein AB1L88_05170 [Tautonia sp. JC769]|uniref:hypothetical protein n=1 Tax=Tautonia sp. JC769 TaxID=3232135 RepID=UPI0034576DB9